MTPRCSSFLGASRTICKLVGLRLKLHVFVWFSIFLDIYVIGWSPTCVYQSSDIHCTHTETRLLNPDSNRRRCRLGPIMWELEAAFYRFRKQRDAPTREPKTRDAATFGRWISHLNGIVAKKLGVCITIQPFCKEGTFIHVKNRTYIILSLLVSNSDLWPRQ